MKRVHVHAGVKDIDAAIAYYTALFGAEPVKVRPDYAKWSPDDLAINFAISPTSDGHGPGLSHLGVELDDGAELAVIDARMEAIAPMALREANTSCCYAKSDKAWSQDPAGIAWEIFHTHGESDALIASSPIATQELPKATTGGACCG